MTEQDSMEVFRVPQDWNWIEDDPGSRLGEYFHSIEQFDDEGDPTGIFDYMLLINFGISSGHLHQELDCLPKSKLIQQLEKSEKCDECMREFNFGFEYDGRKTCLLCFECDAEVHAEGGMGYGHECIVCNFPSAIMFMVQSDVYFEHFPKTPENLDGGITCLCCFAQKCPDFAKYLWRIVLYVEEDFIPEKFRVLTTNPVEKD